MPDGYRESVAKIEAENQKFIEAQIKKAEEVKGMSQDPVNPAHYKKHQSGIECIDVVEEMPFNLGNTVKYIWRAGLKGDVIEDLKKAAWYLNREIERLQRRKTNGEKDT